MNSESPSQPRELGLLHAVAINMTRMIGMGPFMSLGIFLTAVVGPFALIVWVAGSVLALCDGLVWAELSAVFPASGGSYVYLRETFHRDSSGRLMGFLFFGQVLFTGPLAIAVVTTVFAKHLTLLFPILNSVHESPLAAALVIGLTWLLYRKIHDVGRICVIFWIGSLVSIIAVIIAGMHNADWNQLFDFRSAFLDFDLETASGIGAAILVTRFNYLGYYQACYAGDEFKNPSRTLPRSMLISIGSVALLYLLLHLTVLGALPPHQEAFGSGADPSAVLTRFYGPSAGILMILMILWCSVGSAYSGLLGFSRIPYATAQSGDFFAVFGRLHPRLCIPHVSLLLMGMAAAGLCFLDFRSMIRILFPVQIMVQFMGQIVAVLLMRRRVSARNRPFKMWLFPVPAVLAFVSWCWVLATTGREQQFYALVLVVAGALTYLLIAYFKKYWPYAPEA